MSNPVDVPLGLRERKKIKLRKSIQAAALELFSDNGYDATTVEQIAERAETSTSTLYRYFPTKEDLILNDEVDPLIEQLAAARPRDEPLAETLRSIMDAVSSAVDEDDDQTLIRLKLAHSVPALDARYAGEERKTVELLTRVIAERTGRPTDDYPVALAAAATVAVLFTASRRWAAQDGRVALGTLLDQAMVTVEPILTAVSSAPQRRKRS